MITPTRPSGFTEIVSIIRTTYYENNEWELYDLLNDKNELHNVYNNAAYTKIKNDLKMQLKLLEEQYHDSEMVKMNERGSG